MPEQIKQDLTIPEPEKPKNEIPAKLKELIFRQEHLKKEITKDIEAKSFDSLAFNRNQLELVVEQLKPWGEYLSRRNRNNMLKELEELVGAEKVIDLQKFKERKQKQKIDFEEGGQMGKDLEEFLRRKKEKK